MTGKPPYAVFLIGGAANGKSAVLRWKFQLIPPDEDDDALGPGDTLPELHRDRKLDPDDFKRSVPMFTYAPDDAESHRKFGGRRGLGGASGPQNRTELEQYPPETRDALEAYIRKHLRTDLAGFVEEFLGEHNPNFDPGGDWNFGGGLTHELSKVVAQVNLERILDDVPATESFAWDAVGNAERYAEWIERALAAGYTVRVIYVRAPLEVAHRWAVERPRQLNPELINKTYVKARNAAERIKRFVRSLNQPDRVSFEEEVDNGKDLLAESRRMGYTTTGPPKSPAK